MFKRVIQSVYIQKHNLIERVVVNKFPKNIPTVIGNIDKNDKQPQTRQQSNAWRKDKKE